MTRHSAFLLFFVLLCVSLSEVSAEDNFKLEKGESLPRSEVSSRHHAEIEAVLSSDDFARKKTVQRWRLKNIKDKENRDESIPEWLINFLEWLEGSSNFFSGLASVLEVLLWLLAITVVVFVLLKYRGQLGYFLSNVGKVEPKAELPTTMFGLDVTKKSIPQDVVKAAKQYWHDGDKRKGVGMLLQASLVALLHDFSCRFFDSDTESECCERIEQQAPSQQSSYMRELVSAWQQIAYAHRNPTQHQFDSLCEQWREVF